jgi:hypothetical protein
MARRIPEKVARAKSKRRNVKREENAAVGKMS